MLADWRVTRSLVSYVFYGKTYAVHKSIEGSPDRWWVTSSVLFNTILMLSLKGHQIAGELRLLNNCFLYFVYLIEGSPDRWWVTSGCSLCNFWIGIEGSPDRWWVTSCCLFIFRRRSLLKGHQIAGELRRTFKASTINHWHWRVTRSLVSYVFEEGIHRDTFNNWRVTRSLVSYVCSLPNIVVNTLIEGSPDRWWVTSLPETR